MASPLMSTVMKGPRECREERDTATVRLSCSIVYLMLATQRLLVYIQDTLALLNRWYFGARGVSEYRLSLRFVSYSREGN